MQLEHSFSVPVGIDDAWRILLDIERIGPCMPGAAIDSVDGDDFTGTVKVKLGPINLTYKGNASFVEKDESAHRAVIDARGRDARGNGTAKALVTASLSEASGSTTVRVTTDLDITGKPAQFGRGVMVDVGNKLIGQFADSLAATIAGDQGDAAVDATPAAASATSSSSSATDKATDKAPAKAAAKKARPRPAKSAASAEADQAHEPDSPTHPAAENADTTDTTPAYGVPGGVPDGAPNTVSSVHSVNGSFASRPPREVEPIDLLESAGPAVAKRLAPVAVALVVVLVAARRRSSRRRAAASR